MLLEWILKDKMKQCLAEIFKIKTSVHLKIIFLYI